MFVDLDWPLTRRACCQHQLSFLLALDDASMGSSSVVLVRELLAGIGNNRRICRAICLAWLHSNVVICLLFVLGFWRINHVFVCVYETGTTSETRRGHVSDRWKMLWVQWDSIGERDVLEMSAKHQRLTLVVGYVICLDIAIKRSRLILIEQITSVDFLRDSSLLLF